MIFIFWVLFILFICIKLILFVIVVKCGKISYDGFSSFGFLYNPKKDVFYGAHNAWQKNFGYTHFYDVMCPCFQMIIDTLPVRFSYNNENWLISFWKGQYALAAGAEIGIYKTDAKVIHKNTIYKPIKNEEMLDMSFILYKKDSTLIKARANHWWLAVFKLGTFCKPKELSMAINVTFPNKDMLDAFLASFKKLGYKKNDYKVIGTTFYFVFKKSKVKKVWTRSLISDFVRQKINKRNIALYNKYLHNVIDSNEVDDTLIDSNYLFVNDLVPPIFKNESRGL